MNENWVVSNLNNALLIWNRRLKEIYSLMNVSPKAFKGGRIWKVITDINGSMKAIGLALVVLFFLMGVVSTASDFDHLRRPEQALKLFIRFALSRAVVVYGLDLMLDIYEIVQGIMAAALNASGLSSAKAMSVPGTIAKAVEEASLLESIPLWTITIIASIAILIISMLLILSVYGRFFRIYMYTAISPIPLSTFASTTTQHSGISFLKSYIGVCMEGVIIIIACVIFSAFLLSEPVVNASASPVTQVFSYTGEIIFNMLILLGSVRIADRTVKEMMGL